MCMRLQLIPGLISDQTKPSVQQLLPHQHQLRRWPRSFGNQFQPVLLPPLCARKEHPLIRQKWTESANWVSSNLLTGTRSSHRSSSTSSSRSQTSLRCAAVSSSKDSIVSTDASVDVRTLPIGHAFTMSLTRLRSPSGSPTPEAK